MTQQNPAASRLCPCASGRPLPACCQPYLDHVRQPATAEALMRSRYTAYVLEDADYLLATWDAAHRPPRLSFGPEKTEWLGLRILGTEAGGAADDTGVVEFAARFRQHGSEHELCERSRFRREAGAWIYVDGEMKQSRQPAAAVAKAGRNDPCPCGSGMKFKRCCGK